MNSILLTVYPGINPDSSWVPNPTAFKIGSLDVQWYGIFFTIGFILAIALACVKLEKWYKVSCNPFYWFVFIGIPVSLFGARLWSFIIGDAAKLITEEHMNFFQAFFDFRSGGLAIQGGVLFTVIAACIYFPIVLKKPKYNVKTKMGENIYVKQVSMWVYADAIIPCILVGQIIGRWGNFMNQEVYGPAVLPDQIDSMNWLRVLMPAVWRGMFIESDGFTFHQPFFLYESFVNFWFFIALYFGAEFIKQRKAGDIGITYFILYGLLRVCMEPFRSGDFQFSFSIVTSVLFILIGVGLLLLNHLVFSKQRNFKWWSYVGCVIKDLWFRFISLFNKNKKLNATEKLSFKLLKERFYRKDTEMLYYRGQ